MTLEKILNCSGDELAAMSNEEVLKHFEPMLKVIRPEFAPKQEKSSPRRIVDPKKQLAMQLLGAFGVDLSEL